MIDSLSDVERIEVLKGAQGGLYGRNATAGVINIITRKPSMNGFSGDFVGSYGDRNSINLGGYVNVPLSDTLAWTLSAQRTARSEEHTYELQSLMSISYAVFCLK